jgi:hypothetical protein
LTESLFGRLYRFARSTAVEQLENFTTEALGAAIRGQPAPFFDALRQHGVIAARPKGTLVLVVTQEVVPGVGIIDLTMRVYQGGELEQEIWIESKVWAGESGDQMARYQRHLATRPDGERCILMVLGPRPIGTTVAPWLSWQALSDSLTKSGGLSQLWTELCEFLREVGVADETSEPVSAREAASLRDAHSLFRKATKVLTDVNDLGKQRWPDWGWGGRDQVTQIILGQFQRHARFTISTSSRPGYLVIGFTDLYATGEAHLTVWVETDPKKPVIRQGVVAAGEAGVLDASWLRRLDTWQALSKTQRAATVEGSEATVLWFERCLDELALAGIGPTAGVAGSAEGLVDS